jgi:hypothetical protein
VAKMKKNSMDVIRRIVAFQQAVAEGNFEERSKAEAELKEAFKDLGLDEELIKYLIDHFRRATLIEMAHREKCKILQEVRRTILRLAEKVLVIAVFLSFGL